MSGRNIFAFCFDDLKLNCCAASRTYKSATQRMFNRNSSTWFIKKFLVFFFLIIFFGCKNESKEDKNIFCYNESTGIATLDPAFAKNQSVMWVVHQIYNTLVEVDSNLNIIPSLAKSWDISADNLTYTFHLRNDVYFQNDAAFINGKGRKLVANDIVYSFERLMDANVASSGTWIFNKRIAEQNGFIAVDDSTFQIKLIKPFHPILGILSMQYCSIVPREVVEKYGNNFRSHPCGTGPFQLKYWYENEAMILVKNQHYWEHDSAGNQLPYLNAIKISFYNNKATEFLEFRQRELSFVNDIDPSFKDEILTKRGELKSEWNDKIILQKHAYLNTEYFGILIDTNNVLVKNSPLKVKAIRQAINYAIDKQKLMMYLRNSIGIAAEAGIVPGGLPSHNIDSVKGYKYDPKKARELLLYAGFSDANKTSSIKLLTIPIYEDLASYAAKECEEVGIPVQVEVIQKSLLLQQTAKSEALFFAASWIADYPDAENYMTMFYSKNPAPPNYTRYTNAAFDLLYEKALQETNDSARYILYRKMDQLVIDDAPVVPLWYDEVIHFVNKNIEGFTPNALNLLELRRVRIK